MKVDARIVWRGSWSLEMLSILVKINQYCNKPILLLLLINKIPLTETLEPKVELVSTLYTDDPKLIPRYKSQQEQQVLLTSETSIAPVSLIWWFVLGSFPSSSDVLQLQLCLPLFYSSASLSFKHANMLILLLGLQVPVSSMNKSPHAWLIQAPRNAHLSALLLGLLVNPRQLSECLIPFFTFLALPGLCISCFSACLNYMHPSRAIQALSFPRSLSWPPPASTNWPFDSLRD